MHNAAESFAAVKTSHDDIVNSNVHLLDSAFPGTLPVLDHNAVRLSLRTALALGCIVVSAGVVTWVAMLMFQNPRSTFDRKHYFYHDIPSSYQITQHYNPLARQGKLPVREGEFGSKRDLEVGIKQLQIEQVCPYHRQLGAIKMRSEKCADESAGHSQDSND